MEKKEKEKEIPGLVQSLGNIFKTLELMAGDGNFKAKVGVAPMLNLFLKSGLKVVPLPGMPPKNIREKCFFLAGAECHNSMPEAELVAAYLITESWVKEVKEGEDPGAVEQKEAITIAGLDSREGPGLLVADIIREDSKPDGQIVGFGNPEILSSGDGKEIRNNVLESFLSGWNWKKVPGAASPEDAYNAVVNADGILN